ncbi:TPA: enoyl-CoA hydratase-related protein [Acinetobacter baumannii]
MENHVVIHIDSGVLEIQLSRPEKKNALTNQMYGCITEVMLQALENDEIHVILFSAIGNMFTAGNDLVDFVEISESPNVEPKAQEFIQLLAEYRKPIVAAVTGSAIGIGTTMLLHCDLVYIAENAKLLAPFVNLALVPEAGSSLLLAARIGHVRAFGMFSLGESISGIEAAQLGLANAAVPATEVLDLARFKAKELAKKTVKAIEQTKLLMRDSHLILEQINLENTYFSERLRSSEAKEIFRNFIEKK